MKKGLENFQARRFPGEKAQRVLQLRSVLFLLAGGNFQYAHCLCCGHVQLRHEIADGGKRCLRHAFLAPFLSLFFHFH